MRSPASRPWRHSRQHSPRHLDGDVGIRVEEGSQLIQKVGVSRTPWTAGTTFLDALPTWQLRLRLRIRWRPTSEPPEDAVLAYGKCSFDGDRQLVLFQR